MLFGRQISLHSFFETSSFLHSHEGGNLLRKPLEMRCRRTGFRPFGKLRANSSRV